MLITKLNADLMY